MNLNFPSQLIECVPNFSEGKDEKIIGQIADAIKGIDGVKLLEIDPNKDANRTVMTFAGEPTAVCEAAFEAIKKASELIDMRTQKGAHPRIGATDVCPLVPLKGISMSETVQYAHTLAQRVAHELSIPVYCYENAAFSEERKNLAFLRKGEYEGLAERMKNPSFLPDFGSPVFNAKSGATVIGAREILIAYNFSLSTPSVEIAKKIAEEVRESGYWKIENGQRIKIAGKLKHLKAIGWYMEDYKLAQVSTNLTNFKETTLKMVFEEISKVGEKYGVEIIDTELIGLLPLDALTKGISPFEPEKKVIELLLGRFYA
jgi:glutamate formiminotransferase